MLRILPVFEASIRESFCVLCGVPHCNDALMYSIYDNTLPIGVCIFNLTNEGGEILTLRNSKDSTDFDALIIAGRAALDFIERNSGGKTVIFYEDNDILAKELGFVKIGKKQYLNLEGYFGKCKHQ